MMRTRLRRVSLGLLVACIMQCGSPPQQAPKDPPKETAAPAQQASSDSIIQDVQISMDGIDLYMHDLEPTDTNERRKPTLWVHADSGALRADETWELNNAHAIVYRNQEEALIID